jgi:ribonucleoside-diphosphate reductase alpha chain
MTVTLSTIDLLSDITTYGKYARFLPELNRRETWEEVVLRNVDMHARKYPALKDMLYDIYAKFVMTKKVLPSMRSLQFAGKAIEQNPARIFNCSYAPINHTKTFSEAMFLLLGGSGVGVSVRRGHINKLPSLKGPKERTRRFLINDSIEGWAQAIDVLIDSYFNNKMTVEFDYSDIRPKGAYLVTAGGKAPGPQPLKDAIHNIRKVLDGALADRYIDDESDVFIKPVEAFDIMCFIADAVMAGGIRRAAIITIFDNDDVEMLSAKHIESLTLNPQRGRSNNSAVIYRDDEAFGYNEFSELWDHIINGKTGEPGIVMSNSFKFGVNPCVEISLEDYSFCNLTEVVADGIDSQKEFNERAQAAAIIGTLQASYTDFHFLRDIWREQTETDALIGVGITGIASGTLDSLDLKEAAEEVLKYNEYMAQMLMINKAKRTTCVKPSGTSSLVAKTASGIHAYHNDYYIRTFRLNKNEDLYKYLKENLPSSFVEDEYFKPDKQAVLSIPIKAPDGAHLRTEPLMSLLERVKRFNTEWVATGHREGENKNNVSCTISVKDDEWLMLRDWMWANRDTFTGMAVLPYNGGTYVQAPFQDITKEKYEKMCAELADCKIDLTEIVETIDNTDLKGEAACAGGACEVGSV